MINPARIPIAAGNTAQAAAWDGAEGALWAAHDRHFDQLVARYDEAFLDAAAVQPTDRVLDIGCGTGSTTRAAGRRAAAGSALGVDLSAAMVRVANAAAAAEGLPHVRFEHADAQVHALGVEVFDVAISRTGAMFFADPVAAFANVATALRPGGRLVLLVWQSPQRNEWYLEFTTAMSGGRPALTPSPDAPGPFSLADRDRIRGILGSAGFHRVTIRGIEEPMRYASPDAAYDLVSAQLGWLTNGLADRERASALAALRRSIEAHTTADGVQYGSAAWLVTAERVPA